jgi:hypothetical protein
MIKKSFPKITPKITKTATQVKELDINAIVLRTSNTGIKYNSNLESQKRQLSHVMQKLPAEGESYRFISGKEGFSSYAFIDYVAWAEAIDELCIASFRVGVFQAENLKILHERGRLKFTRLLTGKRFTGGLSKADPFPDVKKIFQDLGWWLSDVAHHMKFFLMRTAQGNYYTVETSANLNENPQIEQYTLTNSKDIYDFYHQVFTAVEARDAAGD